MVLINHSLVTKKPILGLLIGEVCIEHRVIEGFSSIFMAERESKFKQLNYKIQLLGGRAAHAVFVR